MPGLRLQTCLSDTRRGYYDEKYYSEVKPFDYGAVSSVSVGEKAEEVHRDAGYKAIYDKVAELKLASVTEMLDISCGNDLLSRTGFTELYRTTSFPLEFLLMCGMNYHLDKKYKDQVEPFVYNFESSFRKTEREQLLNRLYKELLKLGLGRSIYMYAIKNN